MQICRTNLILKVVNLPAAKVDDQIVLLCERSEYPPLDDVLAQFKWCVQNREFSKQYEILSDYLISVFGKRLVRELEGAIYDRQC